MSTPANLTTNQRVWLVTGSSSGLGRSMVEHALAQSDIVVATLRKPEVLDDLVAKYPAERLLVLKVDVTKKEEILNAFAQAKERFGRVDVVYNNAGRAVLSELEGTSSEIARSMFDLNYWGAVDVSLEAVRLFREENPKGLGGILFQISSGTTILPYPGNGVYATSKHALNGFSEILAKELDPAWNIKIITILPAMFRTSIIGNNEVLPVHPAYASNPALPSNAMRQFLLMDNIPGGGDPAKMSKVVWEIAADKSKAEKAAKIHQLPLGPGSIDCLKEKIAGLQAVLEGLESVGGTVDLC